MSALSGRIRCAVSLCGLLPVVAAGAGSATGVGPEVFVRWSNRPAMSLAALDSIRGGFDLPDLKLKISFGLDQAVFVNGELVATNVLTISQMRDSIRAEVERNVPKLDAAAMREQIQGAVAQQLANAGIATKLVPLAPAGESQGGEQVVVLNSSNATQAQQATSPEAEPTPARLAAPAPGPVANAPATVIANPPPTASGNPPASGVTVPVEAAVSPPASAPVSLGTTNPQASAPQASAPQVSAPQVSAPQVSAPQASAPQASVPQASAPQASSPQASSPASAAPVSTPVPAAASTTAPATARVAPAPAADFVLPVTVVQNGVGNAAGTTLTVPGGANGAVTTLIQNSLDHQQIQALTVVNASVNSLKLMHALDLGTSIREALISSLRR